MGAEALVEQTGVQRLAVEVCGQHAQQGPVAGPCEQSALRAEQAALEAFGHGDLGPGRHAQCAQQPQAMAGEPVAA